MSWRVKFTYFFEKIEKNSHVKKVSQTIWQLRRGPPELLLSQVSARYDHLIFFETPPKTEIRLNLDHIRFSPKTVKLWYTGTQSITPTVK